MLIEIDKCLGELESLSLGQLHLTNQKLRSDLAGTEWTLAIALLASERRDLHRELDCSTLMDYAQKKLSLDPQKTNDLLRTARAMVKLPLLSAAFREGRLCWSKVRSLKRVITPETEKTWVEYALTHTAREVERRVVQSPTSWKRNQALKASVEGQPKAKKEEVQLLFQQPLAATKATSPSAQAKLPEREAKHQPEREPEHQHKREPELTEPGDQELPSPKYVRLTIDLTPDQWAIFEEMQRRVWAKRGRRVSRAEVLMELCKHGLDEGSARARARHQVIIHTNESGQAWYETDRGALPVSPEVLEEALEGRPPITAGEDPDSSHMCISNEANHEPNNPNPNPDPAVANLEPTVTKAKQTSANQETTITKPEPSVKEAATYTCMFPAGVLPPSCVSSRQAVPNEGIRAVHARAGNRCERCGSRAANLHIHHRKRVCDGGGNEGDNLELLCSACHGLEHEPERPAWVRARGRREDADSVLWEPRGEP